MPGNAPEDWIMSPAGICYLDLVRSDVHGCFALDEMAKDLWSIALLEASELVGEHAVEGVGDHGHHDVEVDLDQNGGRQCIEIEEFDRLCDGVFHAPSTGIITHDTLGGLHEIVGDHESGFFASIPTEDDLSNVSFVIFQGDIGLMDVRIGVFAFVMREVYPLPRAQFIQASDQVLASAPQGDEPNPLAVQDGKMLVGGELGVEDEGGINAFMDLLPEGQEVEDLFVCFFLVDVRGRIKEQLGRGILGKKGQGPFHPLSPGPSPMFLKDRLIAVMRDGVEIQIDDAPVIQSQMGGLLYNSLLELQDMDLIEAIGVGGHGRALGQHVETGEETRTGIKGMISHVGVPLRADELHGQKREEVTDCRNDLGPRQPRGTDQFQRLKLLQKRDEKKCSSRFTVKTLTIHLCDGNALRSLGNLCSLDGQADLQTGATCKLGKSFFRQNPLHRPDRDVHAILGKQLGDLSCGEFLFSPGADLAAGLRGDPVTRGLPFWDRFRKVDLASSKLMFQQVDICGGVPKAFGHDLCREAVHERGSEGFIPPLPIMDGVDEVGGVAHEDLI